MKLPLVRFYYDQCVSTAFLPLLRFGHFFESQLAANRHSVGWGNKMPVNPKPITDYN